MKRFRVNYVRTNVTFGTIAVSARNEDDALAKGRAMADAGKFGIVTWTLQDASQAVQDAEIDSEEETIEIEEANEDD
jgi:hypothetical protein